MRKALLFALALTAGLALTWIIPESSGVVYANDVEVKAAHLKMFRPLPPTMASDKNPVTEAKVRLGRMLYFDPRLSRDHQTSCNTCHQLDRYGIDEERFSTGFKGQKGDRNSPTVYNAAGHLAQFWDGRAADVEEQAKGPVLNPVEMAMPSEQRVVAVLKSIPEYVSAFRKAFPGQSDPVTFDNMATAIGAFERGLVTPSRWDKFLQGDKNALSQVEKAGLNKYVEVGCHTCHMGAYLGGSQYQKLGVMKPWPDSHDPGRYKVTQSEADKMVFKVPSLRNIGETAPYYHDGSVPTLEKAIELMAVHQLGRTPDEEAIRSITTFLKALTGDIPRDYIKPPVLPKSTPSTPKPELSD